MFNTPELDELFQILNSIKGFKLRQPQWSNTTVRPNNVETNYKKNANTKEEEENEDEERKNTNGKKQKEIKEV